MWNRFKCWLGFHNWMYFPSAGEYRWVVGDRTCQRCWLEERQEISYYEVDGPIYSWCPKERRRHPRSEQ